jgi:hypothetical protein
MATVARGPPGDEPMNESRVRYLQDTLVAALIGYATVAAFFAVLNAAQGRSVFYTAALLGSGLFYGLEDPARLVISPEPVIAFNGVHLLLFVVAGAFMAWLTRLAERTPQGWYVAVVLFLLIMAHVFGLPVWFTDPIRAEIPLWYVVVATSVAALAMAAYFLLSHERLRASFRAID